MARDKTLKITTYIFAGLSMMLNIRLVYSASPFALLRFKFPENLFSIFVRTMAGALELWCLPSMLLGNIIDLCDKHVIGEGHPKRQYSEAYKYDVGGEGLKDKLDVLMVKAQTLHDEAENLVKAARPGTALTALSGPAGKLKDAASQPSKGLKEKAEALVEAINTGGSAGTQAEAVIEKFEAVRKEYEGLTGNQNYSQNKTNPAVKAVDDAYTDLKKHYDTILNVKKATTLKGEVGTKEGGAGQEKIWKKAVDLYSNANNLAGADKLKAPEAQGQEDTHKDIRQLAETLRDAVGAEGSGLQKALSELKDHTGDSTPEQKGELVRKAKEVIKHYDDVVSAYQAVTAKEDQYQSALTGGDFGTIYTQVKSAFQQLKTKFDDGKCKAITPIHDKEYIRYQSIFWSWSNFLTFVILFIVYVMGGDQGRVTAFYWVIIVSGFVFGINMVFVYAMELDYIVWYIMGENTFPVVTSFMHYVTTLIFGNRRKWNSDYIVVFIDIWVALAISLIAASLWTYCYIKPSTHQYWPPNDINGAIISPALMVIVGMGLVYSIYPAIAPGMIVPFYLVDKIEMILLVLTTFPPVIIQILKEIGGFKNPISPICEWTSEENANWGKGPGWHWHFFDIIIVIKISLAAIFIYSLHYRETNISRSIVNQPKMSTTLTIIFYMCHECLLAIGFPGLVGNNGGDHIILPVQYVGALFMIFLAFYSVGYITEYKRHDPSSWPTEGMTKWNALCYWLKLASKITNKNLSSVFTTDLRRDLLLCIQKNELI